DGGTTIVRLPKATKGEPNIGIITNVVFNELLPHTDLPLEDAVELYNTTASDVNIGGWYLGESEPGDDLSGDKLFKRAERYQFPAGTVVPAHGYYVVYE